ncbi:putative nuclease HARBI1 [Heptranchias perlo]|uniref:putative nuclease HARBI1 n=1 Tax=Heptranchias perlo TaxID=212740 RepID=UPI00355A6E37
MYSVTKELVTEIYHLLQPQLQPQSRARTALPVAVKVTVVVNFYASGSFQVFAGDISNIPQFAVHCCIREVTEALYIMRNTFISFSLARDKQKEQARGFAWIAGFPMVQGAIDCMHIALCAPHLNSDIFISGKGFHSLNVQLMCDHRQCTMQVIAHNPGSSHDSFILWQSSVPPVFEPAWQVKGWLPGKKGYPLMTWLMTSVRNTRTRAQQAYNESHATTRNIIEHAISVLKQCLRCLDHSAGAL